MGEELNTALLVALFKEAGDQKEQTMKKASEELATVSEALKELGYRLHKVPLKLISSRWSQYVDQGNVFQVSERNSASLCVYHPLQCAFFGHSLKDEWRFISDKLRPKPLVEVLSTRSGYECQTIDKPKTKMLRTTAEVTTLIAEVLADYGVSVEVPEEVPEETTK